MTFLKQAAGVLLFGALCFSAGKFLSPAKVETKEVERIVYKERTDTTKKVDKKETIHPDGTRVIETASETKRVKDTSADIESQKETKTTSRPDWRVSLNYVPSYSNHVQIYGLDIQRRVFSEIYVGAFVNTQKQIGLSISMGF